MEKSASLRRKIAFRERGTLPDPGDCATGNLRANHNFETT
jgi:hypothetical protein